MSKETSNSDEEAGTGDSNRLHDEDTSSSSAKEALTSQSTAPAAEQDNTSVDVSTSSSISSKNTLGKITDYG